MAFQNKAAEPLILSGFFFIAISLIFLLTAVYYAKNRNFKLHRRFMLFAVTTNAIFLIIYVFRFSIFGDTKFTGPDNIRFFIYYPILIIHITGAIISIALIYIQLKQALTEAKLSSKGQYYFENSERRKRHRSFGTKVAYIWGASFVGGIIVFFMLYIIPWT